MKTITDQLGRTVTFSYPPKRIISFAPAITDTLYSLHLEKEIVGRTRFCIHPKGKVEQAVNVGGTKDLKMERIHALNPDLIIVEKEENTVEMVAELAEYFPVYAFEVQTVEDALKMISDLGAITDRKQQAETLREDIIAAFASLPTLFSGKKATYVIWKEPYMVVGKNTYIQSVLETIGLENPFIKLDGRYPTVTEEHFQEESLDYIFLASEPYPFREEHVKQFSQLNKQAAVSVINGEMFWYGVKMLEAVPYLKNMYEKLKDRS